MARWQIYRQLVAQGKALCLLASVVMALAAVGQGQAQTQGQTQAHTTGGILTIDPEQLYATSIYGQAIEAELIDARAALIRENEQLDKDLSAEEEDLARRRPDTDPDVFRTLADTFDNKVQGIRDNQETKQRDLTQRRENAQQEFLARVLPIIAEIARARGAAAVIERRSVLISVQGVDITTAAVEAINAALGDGSAPQPQPDDTPVPRPEPALPEQPDPNAAPAPETQN